MTHRAHGHNLEPSPSMVQSDEIKRTTGEVVGDALDALKKALGGEG